VFKKRPEAHRMILFSPTEWLMSNLGSADN
jgi:hypothetical protein